MKNFWSSSVLTAAILVLSANTGRSALTEIDESNWTGVTEGEWMIEFYAPWCPACRMLQPIWNEFAEWADDLGISVSAVDVTQNAGLSGRFMITALPTIFHVKDGKFRIYRGARDKDAFISFIEEKKWRDVQDIGAWKDPSSIQMTIVSGFFKMSMVLRDLHTTITEEWGYPYWMSYTFFGLMTVLFGSLLGMILVCIIDCIWPGQTIPPEVLERARNQKFVPREEYLRERKEREEKEERERKEKEEKMEEQSQEDEKAEPASTPSSGAVRKRKAKRAD